MKTNALPINFEVEQTTEINELEIVLTIANMIIEQVKGEAKKRIRTILKSIPHEPNIRGIVRDLEDYRHDLIIEAFKAIQDILEEHEVEVTKQPSELELLYDATFKSIMAQITTMYLERCISSNLKRHMDLNEQ